MTTAEAAATASWPSAASAPNTKVRSPATRARDARVVVALYIDRIGRGQHPGQGHEGQGNGKWTEPLGD